MLIDGLKHEYSKVVSEALRVTSSFLNTLRDTKSLTIQTQYKELALPLFDGIFEKLSKTDID